MGRRNIAQVADTALSTNQTKPNVTNNDISVIDVQADWRRSWTYGRAPNAIYIS